MSEIDQPLLSELPGDKDSLGRHGEDVLIIIPVRNIVLFPGIVLPLSVGRKTTIAAAQEAVRSERPVGLVLQKDPDVNEPGPEDLYKVGTVANVLRYVTAQDGSHHLVCQGDQRFRIIDFIEGHPFLLARIERLQEREEPGKDMEARLLHLKQQAVEAINLLPQAPPEMVYTVQNMTSAPALADFVAGYLDLKSEEKQQILEESDLKNRLDKVSKLLSYRLDVLRLSQQISEKTKESMDDRQREYFLREQLRTIQKELGEGDDQQTELGELKQAIEAANMPEEAAKQARKELKRLESMSESAAEYSMLRTYLEWLVELPWSKASDDLTDITEARRILNEDHYGLEKVKRRVLEYLAVRKLNPAGKSPILCFVGPPGVGKTSLGQSIARAMGRKFARVALGGVHDEAEIRGHRRTYVGALPGNIIQAIHHVGSRNPVLMLDEIDKLGQGIQGDPAAALLEVLDPEQNNSFRDNYLGMSFDLSKVTFIATANVLDTIPSALRDRMEIIELTGYAEEEKLNIARRYLIKRQLENNGLTADRVDFTDAAIRSLICDYTREAGCRNLERQISAVLRHIAMRVAEDGDQERILVEAETLPEILGPRKYESEIAQRTSLPGVATGLAWTPVGGDILFIEATRISGRGQLILTGQLGDVMKESAQTALSLLKSRAQVLGIDEAIFEKSDIHVHVPAGAIPKDGPSAGVTMYMALVSLLTNRTICADVAMTGEITLRGLVLPVGGIKEKTLAALSAGIKTVILPARNRKEWEDIPEHVRQRLKFVWVERVDEIVERALTACKDDSPPRRVGLG